MKNVTLWCQVSEAESGRLEDVLAGEKKHNTVFVNILYLTPCFYSFLESQRGRQ